MPSHSRKASTGSGHRRIVQRAKALVSTVCCTAEPLSAQRARPVPRQQQKQNRLIVAGPAYPSRKNMGKRPRGAASSGASSGPATAKCFLGGLSQMTDSDKLVKYFETKYAPYNVEICVEINQCVGCTRQFFTKPFLGDNAAALAPSSGGEPASPGHRAGVASMAWRTTRRFSTTAP